MKLINRLTAAATALRIDAPISVSVRGRSVPFPS
jgi:hypothetical protein